MRTILFYATFWGYIFFWLPVLFVALFIDCIGFKRVPRRLAQNRARAWSRSLLWIAGIRLTIEGMEKLPGEGGVAIVSNHQGAFDIPLLLGYLSRPAAFVAKKELRQIPFLGAWMEYLGCQFLDRKDRRQGLEVLKRSVEFLQNGGILITFPEGTRSCGGPLGDFKKGSLRVGIQAGVPIVPLTIVDSYRLRESNGGWIQPADVKLIVSDPIDPQTLDREAQKGLSTRVREIIAANLATHASVPSSAVHCGQAPGQPTPSEP